MRKSIKTISGAAACIAFASVTSNAAIIASYADGSSSGSAAYTNLTGSTIATVTDLNSVGLDGLTTSTRSDGRAPSATEIADALPGGSDNNWISASAGAVAGGGAVSTTDYLGMTIGINEATTLASLGFQAIDGSGYNGANLRNGGLVTTYSLFYSLNGGAFTQIDSSKSSAAWTGTSGAESNGSAFLGPQSGITFDLSLIGALVATDSVELRLNLQDTSNLSPKTNFLNSIQLTTVPEPSAALLGGLGMLALLRRRHRSRA